MKKAEMVILGLTGQTGAGKSTASQFFAEQGAVVLNADEIARATIENSLSCLADMVLAYSTEIITPDGKLDRKKLASIVFSDPQKLSQLNAITYPHIVQEIMAKISAARQSGVKLLVLDAPTLFESGLHKECHKVAAILAQREVRRNRIMQRDNMTEQEADQRINAQKPDEFYTLRADCVLRNEDDPQLFRLDLMNLYAQLTANAASESAPAQVPSAAKGEKAQKPPKVDAEGKLYAALADMVAEEN